MGMCTPPTPAASEYLNQLREHVEDDLDQRRGVTGGSDDEGSDEDAGPSGRARLAQLLQLDAAQVRCYTGVAFVLQLQGIEGFRRSLCNYRLTKTTPRLFTTHHRLRGECSATWRPPWSSQRTMMSARQAPRGEVTVNLPQASRCPTTTALCGRCPKMAAYADGTWRPGNARSCLAQVRCGAVQAWPGGSLCESMTGSPGRGGTHFVWQQCSHGLDGLVSLTVPRSCNVWDICCPNICCPHGRKILI